MDSCASGTTELKLAEIIRGRHYYAGFYNRTEHVLEIGHIHGPFRASFGRQVPAQKRKIKRFFRNYLNLYEYATVRDIGPTQALHLVQSAFRYANHRMTIEEICRELPVRTEYRRLFDLPDSDLSTKMTTMTRTPMAANFYTVAYSSQP
jgi:hypothetical protein